VSPADKEILEAYGAAVVECSWARVDEVPMSRIGGRCERLRMLFKDVDVNDSAIPCCDESSQLRQTLAIELCRSLCYCILYMWYFSRSLELNVGHTDWAEQVLSGFSWGHAFFKVNGVLLERYAQCEDAEEVGKVQEAWLARLEREWAESREDKGGQDEWAGGNPNRRDDSEDEEDEEVYGEQQKVV
jgi:pre-rRNA-processing protein TSR3